MQHRSVAFILLLACLYTTGCRVDEHKQGEGENVKIATPFGGMSVKTDDTDILAGIGLPLYPGATLLKKDKLNGKDNGSADVNMSFGSFQLKVKATSYHTGDDPQKVLDFYKKALGRYGAVLQCQNDRPMGTLTRTPEGLTCEDEHHADDKHAHGLITNPGLSAFDHDAKVQLKAGSKKHQHIVDIDPDGPGTKIGLVVLDLPMDFHFGDKDDQSEKEKQ